MKRSVALCFFSLVPALLFFADTLQAAPVSGEYDSTALSTATVADQAYRPNTPVPPATAESVYDASNDRSAVVVVSVVPEPTPIVLLGLGLIVIGLWGYNRPPRKPYPRRTPPDETEQ